MAVLVTALSLKKNHTTKNIRLDLLHGKLTRKLNVLGNICK